MGVSSSARAYDKKMARSYEKLFSSVSGAGAGKALHFMKPESFVKDINDSKIVSGIRDEVFKNSKPASTLVEVSNFVKDGCCVEIEVTAASVGG